MIAALLLLLAAHPAAAQDSPAGRWETVDRNDSKPAGIVRLFLAGGQIYGQIERIYDPTRQALRCDKCDGDRHNQPFIGLQFIRGLRPDGDQWDGGTVLDPDTGRVYKASVRLTDNGHHLIIRGYLGISLFGGSQTWTRMD